MISVRQLFDQTMFGSGSTTGGFMGTPAASTAPLQPLKRRRRGSLADEQGGEGGGKRGKRGGADSGENTPVKRHRNGPFQHGRDTFQLSFLSPPTNLIQTDPYKTYQPTPPIDSDSDSSSDQFAARFAVAVQDEDRDEDMLDDGMAMSQSSDLQWRRSPQVVIGPPTPVSEMGPGIGMLDVAADVDMDRRLEAVTEKKGRPFRMGYRADCEKCRMRVPGHYSHY